jgi:starvation-inducible outer membrane lipoprotein
VWRLSITAKEQASMHTYRPDTPAASIAIAAALMTALTLAICVTAPSELAKPSPALSVDAETVHSAVQATAPTEVDIIPRTIEVVAVREPTLHMTLMRMLHPKPKQQV